LCSGSAAASRATTTRSCGKKADVENKWAQVDNQLQRRASLIGNLVETVKGAAGQEQTVFGDIANARAAMAGAKTPEQGIQAAQGMDKRHRPAAGGGGELSPAQEHGDVHAAHGRDRRHREPHRGRAQAATTTR
jgi:hypothetical protein